MTADDLMGERDGRHDFDFLHGAWHSRQRRLRERLTGCDEWEEFAADLCCTPVLDGAGNFDELTSPVMGYKGLALRLYDDAEKTWSIYWVTGGAGGVEPPVVGRFAGGVGDFFCRDSHQGTPVLVRYRWRDMTGASARWEQAFSTDDGGTWETNWTADFTRSPREMCA